MTRLYTAFVGCKVSQADSEAARTELLAAGLEEAVSAEDADVALIHTCAVTREAERKSRQLAHRLARRGLRVVVAGCAVTRDPAQFDGEAVTLLGERSWEQLAVDLGADAPAAPLAARETDGGVTGTGETSPRAAQPSPRVPPSSRRRTRFVLKAQDGCGGRCAYCVVRLVRGTPRSLPLSEAVAAATRAVAGGCGEVVLSGIDLGAWRDAASGAGLPALVAALVEVPGLARLRLSSIEPVALDDRLAGALAHPLVARHLHVPLQSADDGVLAAMARPYDWAGYRAALERVTARVPDCAFSTDLMVGYPAEDEAAFARSLAAVESGLFGRVHIFAFSPRPGTPAAALTPLPPAVVRRRRAAALAAASAAASAAARAVVGRQAEVLVEERRDGLWRGYSSQYVRYHLAGAAQPGRMVRAVADEVYSDGVRGRVV
ncbi:MAG: MiaB/RimO family radical SAM methylthiotransferase [Thermoleophilia bacterium]|nr:MiaB/RimO family radical SAM methylthiotransferase [Thermoleophilia bacterium]